MALRSGRGELLDEIRCIFPAIRELGLQRHVRCCRPAQPANMLNSTIFLSPSVGLSSPRNPGPFGDAGCSPYWQRRFFPELGSVPTRKSPARLSGVNISTG